MRSYWRKWAYIVTSCVFLYAGGIRAESVPQFQLTTLDWPPYISPDIRHDGYVAKLVTRAFELGGGSTEYTFLPWARALLRAEKGVSVGIFPEYYDESRLDKFVFSNAFPGGPVGLLRLKSSPIAFGFNPLVNQDRALKTLSEYRFGVVRGYLNTPEFDKATYLHKVEARSDESNLRMLQRGRVDMIFIDALVADYIINSRITELNNKTEMLNPALAYKPLYIAFSKKHPDYLQARAIFNKGLKLMQETGELEQMLSDFEVPHVKE